MDLQHISEAAVLTYDEAYRISILQHDGDLQQMDNLVKATVLCKDMDEIMQAWVALKAFRKDGTVSITRVINRFRGPPEPGGNRALTVHIIFQGVTCMLQVPISLSANSCLFLMVFPLPSSSFEVYTCSFRANHAPSILMLIPLFSLLQLSIFN